MIYIIARFKVNSQWACRLFDTDTNKVMDVAENNVISVLHSGRAHIENAEATMGVLMGTTGSLDKFTNDVRTSPIVIIGEVVIKDGRTLGYKAVNCLGETKTILVPDAIYIAKTLGIQNAKVVERDNKEFISSIKGSFVKIPWVDNSDKEIVRGDWSFFLENNVIYKKNITTGEKVKVSDNKVSDLKATINYIYYINHDDNDTIYQRNMFNNKERQVSSESCSTIVYAKDCWLVYISKLDNHMYRIREDGICKMYIS